MRMQTKEKNKLTKFIDYEISQKKKKQKKKKRK